MSRRDFIAGQPRCACGHAYRTHLWERARGAYFAEASKCRADRCGCGGYCPEPQEAQDG